MAHLGTARAEHQRLGRSGTSWGLGWARSSLGQRNAAVHTLAARRATTIPGPNCEVTRQCGPRERDDHPPASKPQASGGGNTQASPFPQSMPFLSLSNS